MRTRAVVAAALALSLAQAGQAAAEVVPLAEGVSIHERSSNPWQKYGYPGANVFAPGGAVLGWRDMQAGTYVPGIPSMLNGDIGAGDADHPGVLNLGADVTRMVRVQNGAHRTVLATRSYGVAVLGEVTVGGLRVARRLRRQEARIERLETQVRRLARR